MGIYKLKEYSLETKDEKSGETKYIHGDYELDEELSFEDLERYGFHFTFVANNPSISATGLRPQIGTNSKGGLGKEANGKTFFSLGVEGTMQIFNRLINLATEMNMKTLEDAPDKQEFLMDFQKEYGTDNLSMLEAFEYMRRYAEKLNYFVFPIKEPEYNGDIDEDKLPQQLKDVNKEMLFTPIEVPSMQIGPKNVQIILNQAYVLLDEFKRDMEDKSKSPKEREDAKKNFAKTEKALAFMQKFDSIQSVKEGYEGTLIEITDVKDTFKAIDFLSSNLSTKTPELRDAKLDLAETRSAMINQVRIKSVAAIDAIRGEADQESLAKANYERIDFNEDRVEWVDQEAKPHNAHTLLRFPGRGVDINGHIESAKIGSDDVRLLSNSKGKPASAIDMIKTLFIKAREVDKSCMESFRMNIPNGQVDTNLIYEFLKYCEIYKQYGDNPKEFATHALAIEKRAVDRKRAEIIERKQDKLVDMTEEEKEKYLSNEKGAKRTDRETLNKFIRGIKQERASNKDTQDVEYE